MKKLKQTLSVFLVAVLLLSSIPLVGLDGIFATKADATTTAQTISEMSVGDKFTFGSYPQSDVTNTLGTELTTAAPSTDSWNSYNYYVNSTQSDYMKYYDLTYNGERYRGVYFTSYRPNSTHASSSTGYTYQDDNGYNTNTIYWFKYEPLTWRVLDPATGYVICETIIDSQAFNNELYENGTDAYGNTAYYNDTTYQHLANNWEYSTIRQWLNNTFYTTAFTSSERSQIPATVHTTPAYSTEYSAYDVGETTDYIFLPTFGDMLNTSYGFSSDIWNEDINRRAHASAYAKAQGVWVSTSYTDSYGEYTSYYRLRSAGDYSSYTTHVYYYGDVGLYYNTSSTSIGIRPALCFNPLSTGTPTTCTHTWDDGEITTPANCVDTGTKTLTCTGCGETKQETISVNSNNHKSVITLNAVAATCTATGLTEGSKCTACDKVLVAQNETAKLAHEYTVLVNTLPSTCVVLGHKVMKCANCEATTNIALTEYAAHTWNLGVITTEPNCVDTGVKTFTCTVCNDTRTETLAINSNNHKTVVTLSAVEATCTATGLTEGSKCTACDKVLVAQKETAKLSHEYTVLVNTVPSTCVVLGHKVMKCANCEATTNIALTEYGTHTWNEGIITTQPTCIEQGIKTFTCTVCSHTCTENIPATGHRDGNNNGVCDNCGENLSDSIDDCKHFCHKNGFLGFIWKIIRFFSKLFRINPTCACGAAHY